ncbi:CYTH domain-containing protein [bacterium]|nr:CYTH domain-containing protein [bacterium]
MAIEIERKFLVKDNNWRGVEGTRFRQGYLNREIDRTVRVRIAGDHGFITIKGKTTKATRPEFEYEIPLKDAEEMLDTLCLRPLIEKTRYLVEFEGAIFEVDEFTGENSGLVIAELELNTESQPFPKPDWLGEEVTNDPRYFNSNLVKNPYSRWR